LNPAHKHVLFLGNRSEIRKNFKTVEKAMNILNSKQISLVAPYPVPHGQVIKYLKSVDVVVAPSLMEGSPNVVKEAMACNCPVVATDVGDVSWLFGNEPGHFLCGFDPEDVAEKIKAALDFSETVGRTNGRKRIETLGLDSRQVAEEIITIYQKVINRAT
jgi:glycosyltransferase involved in cell wall biosynthesis